jgi:hypothetical protein
VIVIDGVILPNNAFASVQAIAAFYNYTAFAGKRPSACCALVMLHFMLQWSCYMALHAALVLLHFMLHLMLHFMQLMRV